MQHLHRRYYGHYAAEMGYETPSERAESERRRQREKELREEEIAKRNNEWLKRNWDIFSLGDRVCIPKMPRHGNFVYDGYGFSMKKFKEEKRLSEQMFGFLVWETQQEEAKKEALLLKSRLMELKEKAMDKRNNLLTVSRVANQKEDNRVFKQDLFFKGKGKNKHEFGPFDASLFILVYRP